MWKRLAYVSGPLRAKPDAVHGEYTPCIMAANTARAKHYADMLWQSGWAAICPHKNTEGMDGLDGIPPEAFIAGDLAILDRFLPLDIIVMLPDWKESRGAVAEYEHAVKLGIDVLLAERFPEDSAFMAEAGKMYRQRQVEAASWAKDRLCPGAALQRRVEAGELLSDYENNQLNRYLADLPTDPQAEGGGV